MVVSVCVSFTLSIIIHLPPPYNIHWDLYRGDNGLRGVWNREIMDRERIEDGLILLTQLGISFSD